MRAIAAILAMTAPAGALAQQAAAGAAQSPLASMLPMVLIFVVFYFLLIKPQQKKFKEHSALLSGLKRGDEVVTAGGIIGKVVEADKNGITTVEIASGVTVQVTKQSIASLVEKPGAAPKAAATKAATKKGKADGAVKNDNVVLKKDQIANDN